MSSIQFNQPSMGILSKSFLLMPEGHFAAHIPTGEKERSAEQIASAISEEADCFAQGIRYAEVSHTISPTPEVAQSVLVALRENGLLAPKTVRCAAPPR